MNRLFKDERMEEGPLGPHIAGYTEQLHADGYASNSVYAMVALVVRFSRWLGCKHIAAGQIVQQHVRDFLRCRQRAGYPPGQGAPTALARLLTLLGAHGIIKGQEPPANPTPSEKLLAEYDVYLQKERGLAPGTRGNYTRFAGQFLRGKFGQGPAELSKLCPFDVIKFVERSARKLKPKRAQMMTSALRSFLRFAQYRGKRAGDLATSVPSVANWSLSTVPQALPFGHVEQVLAGCNRNTGVGRRDYAMLLLLARLGLRGGEVAHLTLEDIEWESACITIRGKAGRVDQLPLPADVGEAIVAYLKDGRPRKASERSLFLRARAPLTGFKGQQAVGSVVKSALARAGIDSPRKGTHQFRHSLASEMLRQGLSLEEIGEILRHRSPDTTAIYAKVDLISLRKLALPWPGGGR